MTDPLAAARDDALSYAASLRDLGYDADVWHYTTTLDRSGHRHAHGFAVEHGPAVRASQLPYGLTVFCEDGQLPLDSLVTASRALVSFEGTVASARLEPWYVAGHNPRETDRQRNQLLNPGTMPMATMRRLGPDAIGDGPHRFYNLRLTRVTLAGMRVDDAGNIIPVTT